MIPILATAVENLTDARYFASWQADWIALVAERSGQTVLDMTAIKEIVSWLDGSQLLLSFDQTPLEEAEWMSREAGLRAVLLPYIPLSGDAATDHFLTIDLGDRDVAAEKISTAFRNGAHVVLSGNEWKEGTEQFLEQILPTPFLRKKCFLDLPMTTSRIEQLDDRFPGIGFCLSGSGEERPGFKSFEQLDELVEVLRPWD